MALKKLKGIKVGRLIVLVLLIAIPVFFFVLIDGFHFITWDQYYNVMPFLGEGFCKFLVWFLAPITFSLPWCAFLYLDRNRVAETFDNMGRALGKVSTGLNIFYSVNALFIFVFFILTLGSPAIAVLAAFGLVPWLIRSRGGRRVPFWITAIPGILLAIVPAFISVGFYWNYGPVVDNIWLTWRGTGQPGPLLEQEGWVYVLYGFGYSVAIGAVIAGFISFVMEGASEVDPYTKRPKWLVYIIEFVTAIGLFLLYIMLDPNSPARRTTFLVISIIAVTLSVLEFVLRWRKNLKRSKSEKIPIAAYIIMPLFIAVDLVRTGKVEFFRSYSFTAALAIACIIYFIIFILAYSYAGEEYPSEWRASRREAVEADIDNDEADEE
ncbi:hypothetical protein EU523_01180 [Candidatus Heimdallarchaeota archaeon]|nr:MAG: hypothetical protein EU523_01180 [Candidatus Heimdallarchaeota archaeon]